MSLKTENSPIDWQIKVFLWRRRRRNKLLAAYSMAVSPSFSKTADATTAAASTKWKSNKQTINPSIQQVILAFERSDSKKVHGLWRRPFYLFTKTWNYNFSHKSARLAAKCGFIFGLLQIKKVHFLKKKRGNWPWRFSNYVSSSGKWQIILSTKRTESLPFSVIACLVF